MTSQLALTIIAPIQPGQTMALGQTLAQISGDPACNAIVPFGRLSNIHFARLFMLDETVDLANKPLPAQLVLMTDSDATLQAHLAELVNVANNGLDQLFGCCIGYPSGSNISREQRLRYLQTHLVQANTTYVNTIGRSVAQVRQEAELREAIELFLDQNHTTLVKQNPTAIRAAIQSFVNSDEQLRWANTPVASPGLLAQLRNLLGFIRVPLIGLILLPVLVVLLPFYLLLLRWKETTDIAHRSPLNEARIEQLASLEDHTAQNQFSAIGYLKPGPFRLLTARVILWVANWGTRHLFSRADLAGVKTIHFARWVFLDECKRLIFTSNYDGSLESYMDDFIDKVAWGLNAVFSNGVDYPRTNWLINDGARDEMAFKAFIRAHQLPTNVWFSAYPQLTALNIENNARIRQGLSGTLDEAQTMAWLARF